MIKEPIRHKHYGFSANLLRGISEIRKERNSFQKTVKVDMRTR